MKTSNIALDLCNKLIDGLRQGNIPWHKPWKCLEVLNPSHKGGHRFSGINLLMLSLHGEGETLFLGKGQAKANGLEWGSKGNVGIDILFPRMVPAKDDKGQPMKGKDGKAVMRFIGWGSGRVFKLSAFKGDKVEAWRKEFCPSPNAIPPHEKGDAMFTASGLEMKDGGNGAYYMPAFPNAIYMPKRELFTSQAEFYRTLFHETGHALSFLAEGEKLDGRFGDEEYSKEELVAEIFANMLASQCGLDIWADFSNTQAYVNGWVKKLTDQPYAIISAANKAQKRFDWLMAKANEAQGEGEKVA